MAPSGDDNSAKPYDAVIASIVDYAYDFVPDRPEAWARAKATLIDALGCACEGLATSAELVRLVGPHVGSPAQIPGGFKLPGTSFQLDVYKGAFDMGASIRYLDHNDAFPGAEWGHPSDNLGAILSASSIFARAEGLPITMRDILTALIKAYEIQGVFQIRNAFNKVGLDHVILVKVASTAVVSHLLGLSRDQALAAVSHAWVDGHPLRAYRQAPNTGPRKGWAAGDACMRAVHLALLARAGQPGLKTALSAPRWGFYDVLFGGREFDFFQPFRSWVVETVLFKVNTAEGHGMTAVEAALRIAEEMRAKGLRAEDIGAVRVRTQEAGMIIINKSGPLHNPADRDHCLKYMVAVVLLKGAQIETEDYQDASPWAKDPRVEELRAKTTMVEDEQFTRDYHNTEIRSLTNAVQVTMKDGTALDDVVVEFPLGHFRRPESVPLVYEKARRNLGLKLAPEKVDAVLKLAEDDEKFLATPVNDFLDMFVV
ncbi:putative 2-methylcitrate dehydratase protein [Lasiodiplodia theobromae]|nr:putative 2-methylcitrate dehydratase protein [Lasiodiplodia theobromae]